MNKDLTVGKPSSVLWRFCLPLFGSIIFQQLYNLADSFVAGRFVGENALAAVGNSYEITLIFIAFAFGCNIGCSVIVSQLFGAKRMADLKTAVYTTLIASGVVCLVLMGVGVIYEGRLIDGTVFDATSKHGGAKTDKFRAGNLIKGWTEALTTMPVGSKRQLYIPYKLAYGERQAGQIPPYSTLVFDLELVSIVKPEVKAEPAGELKENVAVGAEKKVAKASAKSAAKKAGSKKRK